MRQQLAGTSHQHFQSRVLEYLEKKELDWYVWRRLIGQRRN
jgi:hypothetical protein